MNALTGREWSTMILIIVFSSIPAFGGLVRLFELAGGPSALPENPRALTDPWPIVLHISGSFVFCLAGAIQFLPSLRRHHPAAHRRLGRVMVMAGVLSAGTGLWMTLVYAFPEDLQGSLLFSVRVILSLSMIALLGCAIIAAKARDFKNHGASMLRAYAVGQGASTQALLGIAWIVSTGVEPIGFFRDCFMVLCWVVNILVAEVIVRFFVTKANPALPTYAHASTQ